MLNSPGVGASVEPAEDHTPAPPGGVKLSKISSTTLKLLGVVGDSLVSREVDRKERERTSVLTQEVERLVSAPGNGDAEADDS